MKCLLYQCRVDGVHTASALKAHRERMITSIREACATTPNVRMVVLPELSTIEYSERAFSSLDELAEPLDGESVSAMAELAQDVGVTVVFGMPRISASGRYTISQVALNAQGALIGHYDKVHVAQFGASAEKRWFDRGEHSLVFEADGFRVGVVICYDMRFPTYIHGLVQRHQLDVVLHPVAFTRDGSWPSWPAFVTARALENQVYWLSINRAGCGWGGSMVCPPWVDDEREMLRFDETESLRVVTLSRDAIAHARATYPFREDALADYTPVLSADPT